MPAKFDRCVKHLRDQGASMDKAFAICQVSINKAKSKNKTTRSTKPATSKSNKSPKVVADKEIE